MSHPDPEAGKVSAAAQLVTDGDGMVTGLKLPSNQLHVTANDFSLRSERVQGAVGPIILKFDSVQAARNTYRFKYERHKLLRSEAEALRCKMVAAQAAAAEAGTELDLVGAALLSIEAGERTHLNDPLEGI